MSSWWVMKFVRSERRLCSFVVGRAIGWGVRVSEWEERVVNASIGDARRARRDMVDLSCFMVVPTCCEKKMMCAMNEVSFWVKKDILKLTISFN